MSIRPPRRTVVLDHVVAVLAELDRRRACTPDELADDLGLGLHTVRVALLGLHGLGLAAGNEVIDASLALIDPRYRLTPTGYALVHAEEVPPLASGPASAHVVRTRAATWEVDGGAVMPVPPAAGAPEVAAAPRPPAPAWHDDEATVVRAPAAAWHDDEATVVRPVHLVAVLRHLAASGPASTAAVADGAGLDLGRTRLALHRLTDLGLVDGGGPVAVALAGAGRHELTAVGRRFVERGLPRRDPAAVRNVASAGLAPTSPLAAALDEIDDWERPARVAASATAEDIGGASPPLPRRLAIVRS